MTDFKKLNIEYKAAAVFGIGSFLLSVIASIFSGNSAGIILLRSVIFAVIFCVIGFASLYVMKKYVPEIYEIFNSGIFGPGADSGMGNEEEISDGEIGGEPDRGNAKAEEKDKISSALDASDDIESESDLGAIDDVSGANNANKEMERMFKYEPEIAAQAIRTMMKKDDK